MHCGISPEDLVSGQRALGDVRRGVGGVDKSIIAQRCFHGAHQVPHVLLIWPHEAKLVLHLKPSKDTRMSPLNNPVYSPFLACHLRCTVLTPPVHNLCHSGKQHDYSAEMDIFILNLGILCDRRAGQQERSNSLMGGGAYVRFHLHHEDVAASFVEEAADPGQQHIPPLVHQLQICCIV